MTIFITENYYRILKAYRYNKKTDDVPRKLWYIICLYYTMYIYLTCPNQSLSAIPLLQPSAEYPHP